jgi:hypothetical protein
MREYVETDRWGLRLDADDVVIDALEGAIAVLVERSRGSRFADRVPQVLEEIDAALREYEAAEMLVGAAPPRLVRLLTRIAASPHRAHSMMSLAGPTAREVALDCLWRAAVDLGLSPSPYLAALPQQPPPPQSQWRTMEVGLDPWLEAVSRDRRLFAVIAERALQNARGDRSPSDWLRPFRELKKKPTPRRLGNILRRDRKDGGLRTNTSVVRCAVAALGLFGDRIPPDWYPRVAGNPGQIRRIAKFVCDNFAYKQGHRGTVPDEALDQYADQIAAIHEKLTGRRITYAKPNGAREDSSEAYGPGLDLMLAALHLVDPGLDRQAAVAQINRIRGWDGSSRH